MTFREGLVNARSHIIFLAALFSGLALVIQLEDLSMTSTSRFPSGTSGASGAGPEVQAMMAPFEAITPLPLVAPRPATPDDLVHAKIAWRYFQNNTDPVTGLANSADKYPSTTMWETGSYFVATIAAELLGVIPEEEARARFSRAIETLSRQRLVEGAFPNKAYDVTTNEVVDYANKPSEKGIGWSALDIARLVGTLHLIEVHHPDLAPDVQKLMARWDLDALVADGQLVGGNLVDGAFRRDQEGRLGYEQYAAKAMMLSGFDMYRSYDASAQMTVQEVEGQPIPVDRRLHRNITPAFATSEPYLFDGIEFGFDARSHRFATALYQAQEARHLSTGILTAVSESHIDAAPYFIYSTVWGGGAPWAVMSFKGERFDSRRTIATKVAFGWNALFGTEYTRKLVAAVVPLADPERGFPEGIYEADGKVNGSVTANTNAVILAALAFSAHGPLLHARN